MSKINLPVSITFHEWLVYLWHKYKDATLANNPTFEDFIEWLSKDKPRVKDFIEWRAEQQLKDKE